MSLDHLLLGMLKEPASGYDLKRAFGQTQRHFWDAELSQIYPALQRLERRGLLSSTREASARGPGRRVYRRTAAGTRELKTWLRSEPVITQPRFAFLGQLVFHDELRDFRRTRAFLERLRAAFATRLEELCRIEAMWSSGSSGWPDALPDEDLHGHIALRLGITRMESAIAWCDESICRVDARLEHSPSRRSQ